MTKLVFRWMVAGGLLVAVYLETGPWTTLAMGLTFLNVEAVQYSIYRFYKSIKDAAEGEA